MKDTIELKKWSRNRGVVVAMMASLPGAFLVDGATFYWDATGPANAAGFGDARGTWAQNSTSGGGRWVTNSGGTISGSANQTHGVNDIYNFGTAANGLGAGSITVSGTVAMGNTNFGSASGNITLNGGTINYGDARTITVNNTSNAINSVVAGAGTSLTKAGSGALVFGRDNTYTGETRINAGTLALSSTGSINATSGVVLGGGTFDVTAKAGGYHLANLSGSGTVAGALTISSQLAVGASAGTIGFDDLGLGSGATFVYEVQGGGNEADLANVSGALSIDTSAILDLVQMGTYTPGDRFTLFAYETGNLTGTFSSLADGASFAGGGGTWVIDYDDTSAGLNGGTGTSFVTITAIPEPASALLGGVGLLLLLRRRRG